MRLFSLVKVVMAFVLLPCVFFFRPFVLLFVILLWLMVLIKLVGYDLSRVVVGPKIGFWLFLVSEIIVFISLLVTCLWFQDLDSVALSYVYSVPLLETMLLVSSSFFISAYHCLSFSSRGGVFLALSLFSAYAFIFIAVYEILISGVSSLYSPHSASCYLVLGLHFSHVLIGSALLVQLLVFSFSEFVRCRSDVYIIYWHFVDYV